MAKKRTTTRSTKAAQSESADVQNTLNANDAATPPMQQTNSDVQNTLHDKDADTSPLSEVQDRQSLGLDSILGAILGGAGGGGQMPQQPQGRGTAADDPLGAILGGMMSQGSGQMPSSAMGAQAGGLDLGSILGGLLGGGLGGGGMQAGMMGGVAGALLGPLADSISEKTGLPRAVVMAGATFLLSKLMSGGLQGSVPAGNVGSTAQNMPTQPNGGIDLGSILGGLLGGGGMPQGSGMPTQGAPGEIDLGSILGGMMSQTPVEGSGQMPQQPQAPQGGVDVPTGDKVLGRIGQSMDSPPSQPAQAGGIRIQGLVAGNEPQFLQDQGLVSEFAQQSGLDEQTAEQSLSAILRAMQGEQP